MKTILITGAEGFIGQRLVEMLQSSYNIIALNRSHGDIVEHKTFEKLKNERIDHIFHLAALTFVPESWDHPAKYTTVNISGTVNVLELAKSTNASVTFLSSYLYGNPVSNPINEEAKVQTLNPYALSKLLAEEVCQFYFSNFNVSCTIIRPFNIYGPGQKSHFLIPKIINQLLFGDYIEVNTLTPKRDYLYIDDIIEALEKTIYLSKNFQIINIGYGKSYSVGDVINIAKNLTGREMDIKNISGTRKNEIMDVVANIDKARTILNWMPKTDLYVGLQNCINFSLKNEK